MKALKLRLHRLLRSFGVDLIRYPPPLAPPDIRSFGARGNWWIARSDITLLLDVGANVVQYASMVRTGDYNGPIVSFEPLSTAFSELQKSAQDDPRWKALA